MFRFSFRLIALPILLVACLLAVSWALSGSAAVGADQGANLQALQRVMQIQNQHNPRILALNGVVGTATGVDAQGRWAVKVYTKQAGVPGIAQQIDGVPVEVEVTGEFFAMKPPGGTAKPTPGDKIDPTAFWPRPVPIGVSTGNKLECSAGTIGCRVIDASGNRYALSNNHVYARENNATLGETVVQPGRYDTNCSLDPKYDLCALSYFIRINFDGSDNTVDAAIASCSTGTLGTATPTNGYGTPSSTLAAASIGLPVQKYGRTTSLTKGTVSGINATLNIGYSSGTARFVSQIVVTSRRAFIRAGDSGSLLVTDPGKNPVGLLFAGNTAGTYAIANDINLVLHAFPALGLTIDDTIDGQ